jgi:hypothetical protein
VGRQRSSLAGRQAELNHRFHHGTLVLVLDKPANDGVNAYVCEGVTCLEPVDDIAARYTILGEDSNAGGAH